MAISCYPTTGPACTWRGISKDYWKNAPTCRLSTPPGTVRTYFGSEFDAFLGKPKLTVHEVGLVDLLDIARLMDAVPAQRAIVAVQPLCATWGSTLTKDVDAAVPEIASRVIGLLDEWPS